MSMLITVIDKWLAGEKCRAGQLSTDGENLFSYRIKIGRTKDRGKELIDFSEETGTKMYVTTASHIYEIKKRIFKNIVVDLEKIGIDLDYPIYIPAYGVMISVHDSSSMGIFSHDGKNDSVLPDEFGIIAKSISLSDSRILYYLNAHAYDYLKILEKHPKIISPEGLY